MTKRIRRLHGPAFAFLVVPDGEDLWERRGRVRRIGLWQRHWPHIREGVAEAIEEVTERAAAARREGGGLLVLGV